MTGFTHKQIIHIHMFSSSKCLFSECWMFDGIIGIFQCKTFKGIPVDKMWYLIIIILFTSYFATNFKSETKRKLLKKKVKRLKQFRGGSSKSFKIHLKDKNEIASNGLRKYVKGDLFLLIEPELVDSVLHVLYSHLRDTIQK